MNLPFLRRKAEPMPTSLSDEALSAVGHLNAVRAQGRAALRKYHDRLRIEIARAEDALAKVEAELSFEEDVTVAGNFADIEAEIGDAIAEIEHLSEPAPPSPKTTRKKAREVVA